MIILDTQILVWWVNDSDRLTEQHRHWLQEYQAQGLGVIRNPVTIGCNTKSGRQ